MKSFLKTMRMMKKRTTKLFIDGKCWKGTVNFKRFAVPFLFLRQIEVIYSRLYELVGDIYELVGRLAGLVRCLDEIVDDIYIYELVGRLNEIVLRLIELGGYIYELVEGILRR